MVNRRLVLHSFILVGLTASLAAAGPIGSIFFGSLGSLGDVQLILNGTITINASNTGWYTSANTSNEPGGANYITGLCSNCGGPTFRDFFSFSIPGETTITTATLNIRTYTYDSTNPSETLGLFDVSTPLATTFARNHRNIRRPSPDVSQSSHLGANLRPARIPARPLRAAAVRDERWVPRMQSKCGLVGWAKARWL